MAEPRKRPKVIVTRRLPEAVEARMAELFDVELNPDDTPFSPERMADAMQRAEVLVPTVVDHVGAGLIAGAGERLKLIANFGVGIEHVDLHAARAKGILVTNTPGVLTDDTADMVMALILAVPRRLSEGEKWLRAGEWRGWSPTGERGHRVGGKALGIVGMGRIGQAVAERARGFKLAVHYHNRKRLPAAVEAALSATWWADLDAMLGAVDIVSINCPATPETRHLFDAARLAKLQRHAYLINTARGEIIDEAALAAALHAGQLAGAGLDVFEHEPDVHPGLLETRNTVLLPHMGSATFEGRRAMGERVITNIRVWADGHRPPDQVFEGWT